MAPEQDAPALPWVRSRSAGWPNVGDQTHPPALSTCLRVAARRAGKSLGGRGGNLPRAAITGGPAGAAIDLAYLHDHGALPRAGVLTLFAWQRHPPGVLCRMRAPHSCKCSGALRAALASGGSGLCGQTRGRCNPIAARPTGGGAQLGAARAKVRALVARFARDPRVRRPVVGRSTVVLLAEGGKNPPPDPGAYLRFLLPAQHRKQQASRRPRGRKARWRASPPAVIGPAPRG
jgi:hypothetical protein